MTRSNGTTESAVRKHKFVSFTERISSIKIDPARRATRTDDSTVTECHFLADLERFSELNLTTNFTNFAHNCRDIAGSLPQILHHQNEIAELLLTHINEADVFSIEPLFTLVTSFARDLGPDFEPYFQKVLSAIVSVIRRNDENVQVLEAAFYCMAYLFKYLRRLLTVDLRPLYDYIVSLFALGTKQRGYILRFAGESVSFLIRNCKEPQMHQIMEHILEKLASDANENHAKFASILLADSVKGLGITLHSKAKVIFQALFNAANDQQNPRTDDLICNVLVSCLHHTRAEHCQNIIDLVLEFFLQNLDKELPWKCLFIVSSLRKGQRVQSWEPIVSTLKQGITSQNNLGQTHLQTIVGVLALADFSSLVPHFQDIAKKLSENPTFFASISVCIKDLNPDTYSSLFEPFLNKLKLPADPPAALLCTHLESPVRDMRSEPKLPKVHDRDSLFHVWWLLQTWPQAHKVDFTTILKIAKVQFDDATERGLQADVIGSLLSRTQITSSELSEFVKFLNQLASSKTLLDGLRYALPKDLPEQTKTNLVTSIGGSLTSWNLDIRHAAIGLCQSLCNADILNQCMVLDQIPYEVTNVRNIVLHLRTLADKYSCSGSDALVDFIVPRFFFGLLGSRFQPVWKEVLNSMPKIASKAPETFWSLAYELISNTPTEGVSLASSSRPSPSFSALDCTFLSKLQILSLTTLYDFENPEEALWRTACERVHVSVPDNLASLAIKALQTAPKIAERNSNLLVPYILNDNDVDAAHVDFSELVSLLELFSQFTKPKKLTEFTKVREQYQYFLGSRHAPIQKVAIKCMLTLNTDEGAILRKYRGVLESLADDTRFKDQLTLLTSNHDDENSIHSQDLETVYPVIIRLLYGRSQTARHSTGGTKANFRRSVFESFHFFKNQWKLYFVQLAIEQQSHTDEDARVRRQLGLATFLLDFIDEMATDAASVITCIVDAIIGIAKDVYERDGSNDSIKQDKTLRQTGIKCIDKLVGFLSSDPVWESRYPLIYQYLIEPRLPDFGRLNLEQPSALMRLLLTLSAHTNTARLLNQPVLEAVASCLKFDAKQSVTCLVYELFDNCLTSNTIRLQSGLLTELIEAIPRAVETSPSPPLLKTIVSFLNNLINDDSFQDSQTKERLLNVYLSLLTRKDIKLPLSVKATLFQVFSKTLSKDCSSELVERAFLELSIQFRQISERSARYHLSECYRVFGERDERYQRTGRLIAELNAVDPRRLGEPDFNRRLTAFAELNESLYRDLSPFEFHVVLQNMLFFIKDPEELALRNNALFCLKRFLERVSTDSTNPEFRTLVQDILLPAVRTGLRGTEEWQWTIFIELVGAIANTVASAFDEIADLEKLTFSDQETSFYENITHIQYHRRRRAVQRLAELSRMQSLKDSVVSHYIIPSIERFASLSGNKDADKNSLAQEVIQAIEALTPHLSWAQFQAIGRRYVSQVVNRPLEIKKTVKLVTALGSGLAANPSIAPNEAKLDKFVLGEVVEPLHAVMSQRSNDDENLPDRITLGLPVVLWTCVLPEEIIVANLPGKLTWLSHLLRSRVPELRDSTRVTLAKACSVMGIKYFGLLLGSLRSALRRGPQLHVLGYTVHSLLLELEESMVCGDLDDSARELMDIILEDSFGATGQEKDAEGYTTQAKEIKQHKSFNSAEILAKVISIKKFNVVIGPIKEYLLRYKLSSKSEHKVEDLLKRIIAGLQKNSDFGSQSTLVLGYQLFFSCIVSEDGKNQVESDGKSAAEVRKQAEKEAENHFLVRLSSRKSDMKSREYPEQLSLVQMFSLDLLRQTLGKEGLLTPANVKGLISVVSEGSCSKDENVQSSAIRLAAFALKVDLSGVDEELTLLGRRALDIVQNTSGTESLLFQGCLRLLDTLLKSSAGFELKESSVGYILERIAPDIEEPDRQGATLSFIRSIVSRKTLIPQMYDIMSKVAQTMVTNHNSQVRNACRSVYFQFLLNYPQSQRRFDKSISFLVSNLEYPSTNGQLSVLEMIHMILGKVNSDQLNSHLPRFFAGLVLLLVNSDTVEVRAQTSTVLKKVLSGSPAATRSKFVESTLQWLGAGVAQVELMRAGLEVVSLMKETGGFLGNNEYPQLSSKVDQVVKEVLRASSRGSGQNVDWQLVYLSLKNVRAPFEDWVPEVCESAVLYPHPWVRALASRVFGSYYAESKSAGLELDVESLTRQARKFVRQLGAPKLEESDGVQIVKNLVFIVGQWIQSSESPQVEHKDGTTEECVGWLVRHVAGLVRLNVHSLEAIGTKRACVQLLAVLPQVLGAERVHPVCAPAIHALYLLQEQLGEDQHTLQAGAGEALDQYQDILGTTVYLQLYSDARQQVQATRRERRAKRSVAAVTAPEAFARKKLKRNAAKRDSRRRPKA